MERKNLLTIVIVTAWILCWGSVAHAESPISDAEGECIPSEFVVIEAIWLLDDDGQPIGPGEGNLVVSGDTLLDTGDILPMFAPILPGDALDEGIMTNVGEQSIQITLDTGQQYDIDPLATAVIYAAGDPTHKAVCVCQCNNGEKSEEITLDLVKGGCKFYKGKACEMPSGAKDGKVKQSCHIKLVKC